MPLGAPDPEPRGAPDPGPLGAPDPVPLGAPDPVPLGAPSLARAQVNELAGRASQRSAVTDMAQQRLAEERARGAALARDLEAATGRARALEGELDATRAEVQGRGRDCVVV